MRAIMSKCIIAWVAVFQQVVNGRERIPMLNMRHKHGVQVVQYEKKAK